jgi:hypothetical protein
MKHLLVCLLALLVIGCGPKNPEADLVISGGTIYTGDEANDKVEAVAVKGEKILFAGSLAEAENFAGSKTLRIDLKGKTMTPGFIEGHGHLIGLGFSELTLNLENIKSYAEMVEKVKEAVAKVQPGEWIIGRGWHQDKWDSKPDKVVKGFQTHELLSAVSPNNPVFLTHASGHAGFANAKAMQIAGVNQLSKEQSRGYRTKVLKFCAEKICEDWLKYCHCSLFKRFFGKLSIFAITKPKYQNLHFNAHYQPSKHRLNTFLTTLIIN